MRKIHAYICVTSACILLFSLQAFSQPSPNQPSKEQPDSEINRIHFGDLIDVDVLGSFEFDWRGTVNPEGFLAGMDSIAEPIHGLCLTEDELAKRLVVEYAKVLRDPQVVVKIIDRSNRPLSVVEGAVKLPQRFQIKRPVFLNELLIVAGGLNDRTSGEIRIFRPQNVNCFTEKEKLAESEMSNGEGREKFIKASRGNGSETLNIRIVDLLKGNKDANPRIMSGDIVTVVESSPIYVIGGVTSPRQIPSRSQITLTRAISSAGGLSKDALDKVVIFRRKGAENKTIEADLKKIDAKQEEDVLLEPFDIVDVSQKGREKRKSAPVIDSVVMDTSKTTILPLRIVD